MHSRSSTLIIRVKIKAYAVIPSNINSTLSPRNANATKRTSFSLPGTVKPVIDALPQVRSIILPVRNVRFLDSGRVTNVLALHPESGTEKNACAQDQQHGTESNVLAQKKPKMNMQTVAAMYVLKQKNTSSMVNAINVLRIILIVRKLVPWIP